MTPIDEMVTELLLAEDKLWLGLAERARAESRATRETYGERETLAIELLASWLRYHMTPKLEERGFRNGLLRRVCDETVDWKRVASTLFDSLKIDWVRDGIPVTVISAQGVRRGTLCGNTITPSGDADAECDADAEGDPYADTEGEAE